MKTTYRPNLFSSLLALSIVIMSNTALAQDEQELPLLSISDLKYQGGFRLPVSGLGSTPGATHSYSPGAIALNPANNSLFTVSHDHEQGIGEFAIPELVNSEDASTFNTATVLQGFRNFHQDGQAPTGIDAFFRVTGMALVANKLVVNYMSWYDAAGTETDTSVVFQSPSDLRNSEIVGPFQLDGAAHASGWITPVPTEWRAPLGGNYVAGHAHGSIVSRLSTGPSAHVLNISGLTEATSAGPINTNAVLDFSLSTPLADTPEYDPNNDSRQNDLWSLLSGASYGFIVPGTNTYLTVGFSGGNESGIGYKITQSDGTLCPGFCSYQAGDAYNYYWLWKVTDLVKVKQGLMASHEVRPYDYGILDTAGNTAEIKGAAYDANKKRLYISLQNGDTVHQYDRPPLILAYSVNAGGKNGSSNRGWLVSILMELIDKKQ